MDVNEFTPQIAETVERWRKEGLTDGDQKILQNRLAYFLVERPVTEESVKSKWRNDIARQAFYDVRSKNAHLFLILVLLITPTQCGQRAFCNRVMKPLLGLESYDLYHFSLRPQDRRFLENTAKTKRFLEEPNFTALMQALFPDATDRTFTYGYSKMPRKNLPLFLRTLAVAIEKSNLYLGETERGDEETSAATVLIPAGDVDCACSITVSRPVIIEALSQLHLTKVFEEGLAPFSS